MRGRKPKPVALKILEGTYRKDRDKGGAQAPKPEQRPRAPRWLDAIARAEWNRVAPYLHELGLLTHLDIVALGAYCQVYARAVQAEELIGREGMTIRTPQGTIAHPAIAIAKHSWALARAYATEFGATPSSRTRIHVKPPLRKADVGEPHAPRYRFGRPPGGSSKGA